MATILIAEDDRVCQKVLYEVLHGMGHQPIISRDGRLAWQILQDNPWIKLVMTDVIMPEMDGEKLVQHIRASHEFAGLPVIIISGHVGPRRIAELLRHGSTEFLGKPLRIRDIRKAVKRYVPVPVAQEA